MTRIVRTVLICTVAALTAVAFMNAGSTQGEKIQSEKIVEGLNVGNKAPELNFPDPNGNKIALSSLKGKVVLVDFWASWCGPCRMENPNVVRVFETYKDKKFKNGKGFTIYGVSLDQQKDRWQQAILRDRLNWETHVSDLKGWGSEAGAIYNVRAIPSNFLIDGDGIIIAKNFRGPALEEALSRLAVN